MTVKQIKEMSEKCSRIQGLNHPGIVEGQTASAGVSIGTVMQVLFVLGLEKDLLRVASDDELGRKLQDSTCDVSSVVKYLEYVFSRTNYPLHCR